VSRLILFAGSSPGAGKTTLSGILAAQMIAQGRPAIWLAEEEIEADLERHGSIWHDGDLGLESFLRAAAAFVESFREADVTILVDSWLPPMYLLVGRYSPAIIEQFGTDLYESLRSLDPLLVYVRCEPRTALNRAVEQRGGRWINNIRGFMNGWRVPYFSAATSPFPSVDEVAAFFEEVDRLTLRIVERWPGETLVLDSTTTPLAALADTLLGHFGLHRIRLDRTVPLRLLESYAGSYAACDPAADPPRIVVWLDGARLIVDSYWPGGTILIPIDDSRFRLGATHRFIVFDPPNAGGAPGLSYIVRGAMSCYRRTTG
jgi:hypothetical protein